MVKTVEFKEELQLKVNEIENVLRRYLPKEEGYQKVVMEAMNYSMLAGGKRIRPLLMFETFRIFSDQYKEVEPFMAAMEMIHTYSLVHDDLPAMDNDEYRRGRKTTHVVYGEAVGILAGDALLNFAFETTAEAILNSCRPQNAARALQLLSQKAGIFGMIGGQTADVTSVGKDIPKELLDFIYKLKTGALIEASMMIGAVLGGAAEQQIQLVEKVAADVGLAFQIQDDILDVTSTTEILGKPVFSDEKNQKTTYVTLYGIEKAKEQVELYSKRAIQNLKALNCKDNFLEALLYLLIYREK